MPIHISIEGWYHIGVFLYLIIDMDSRANPAFKWVPQSVTGSKVGWYDTAHISH